MYKKLIKADNPQIFFKHELGALIEDNSNYTHYKTQYFTFLDENDKFADKVLYVPYDVNDKYYWGDKICVMKRCVEEHYSQSIIDCCRKEHKKYGTKQYEWHLVKYPCVINPEKGECVFIANHEMDYVYVYDNLIYVSNHFGHEKKILDMNGKLICGGYIDMFVTRTHLIVKYKHDYKNNIDCVVCINRKTCEIENEY